MRPRQLYAEIAARELCVATVGQRVTAHDVDRTPCYRVLHECKDGRTPTPQPRLVTFVALCAVVAISPTELLRLAGLWPMGQRTAAPRDLHLRDAFARLLTLAPAD